MKELIIAYKLFNHEDGYITKHVYCVKLPRTQELNKDQIDSIKKEVRQYLDKYTEGYTLVCEHVSKHEKKMLIEGTMRQVKFYKKVCFDYSRGTKPCDDATLFNYEWHEGEKIYKKYVNGNLETETKESIGTPSGTSFNESIGFDYTNFPTNRPIEFNDLSNNAFRQQYTQFPTSSRTPRNSPARARSTTPQDVTPYLNTTPANAPSTTPQNLSFPDTTPNLNPPPGTMPNPMTGGSRRYKFNYDINGL